MVVNGFWPAKFYGSPDMFCKSQALAKDQWRRTVGGDHFLRLGSFTGPRNSSSHPSAVLAANSFFAIPMTERIRSRSTDFAAFKQSACSSIPGMINNGVASKHLTFGVCYSASPLSGDMLDSTKGMTLTATGSGGLPWSHADRWNLSRSSAISNEQSRITRITDRVTGCSSVRKGPRWCSRSAAVTDTRGSGT